MAEADRLALAAAVMQPSVAGKQRRDLASRGWGELKAHYATLSKQETEAAENIAASLLGESISAVLIGDETYPRRLLDLRQPPPILFWWGNLRLADRRGVGMCGSRDASQRSLRYARLFGRAVVERGLQVISGYARGVDMETHLGALEAEGSTIIVLAEGIAHFRRKRAFADLRFDEENVLAVSQFAPGQTWTAGAAMTRNAVIAGLAQALLVIEAREKGGTLNAGLRALEIGRPVYAIAYADDPPAGNQILVERGAHPLRSQHGLLSMLDSLAYAEDAKQLALE